MGGQLATGLIEGIWRKLKGVAPIKRTFTMFVNTVLRVACELSGHGPVDREKIEKGFTNLIRQQSMTKGSKLDHATFQILRRCFQKLTFHAITVIRRRLLLVNDLSLGREDPNVVTQFGIQEYQFRPQRKANGVWVCKTVEGKMCWQNKLYGLPCVHILKIWHREIKDGYCDITQKEFCAKDIERSAQKMYRQSTYTTSRVPKLHLNAIMGQPRRAAKNRQNNSFLLNNIKSMLDLMASSLTTDAPLKSLHEILTMRAEGHQPTTQQKWTLLHGLFAASDRDDIPELPRDIPLVTPPSTSSGIVQRKRLLNRGAELQTRRSRRSQHDAAVNTYRFDFASLTAKSIIANNYVRAFFGSGQDAEAAAWLRENRKHFVYPKTVGLHVCWVDHYYAADHPSNHQTRNPAVYGVDVITLASMSACFSWHASQCQSEQLWNMPGPFTPKNVACGRRRAKHHNDHKWKLLKYLEILMCRSDIFTVQATAMRNRFARTFYTTDEIKKNFHVQFKDLAALIRNQKQHKVVPTRLKLKEVIRTVLGGDAVIVKQNELNTWWRTRETLSQDKIKYTQQLALGTCLAAVELNAAVARAESGFNTLTEMVAASKSIDQGGLIDGDPHNVRTWNEMAKLLVKPESRWFIKRLSNTDYGVMKQVVNTAALKLIAIAITKSRAKGSLTTAMKQTLQAILQAHRDGISMSVVPPSSRSDSGAVATATVVAPGVVASGASITTTDVSAVPVATGSIVVPSVVPRGTSITTAVDLSLIHI